MHIRRVEVDEYSTKELADFLVDQEDDRASFRQICKHMKVASQIVRDIAEASPELFSVEQDHVALKDPKRKNALTCLVKQLVTSEMQRDEINPEKALDSIWSAAHFALKATPKEVKKVFEKVSQTVLRKTQKVPRGYYPANMPLALACIIDRAVYLARRQKPGEMTVLEKALGPNLHSILLGRWQLGRVRGSQFLANLFLTWERLGYFQERHLEECKKHLLVLLAFVRPEGVPDPPDKDEGAGWYKVVARDPGEDENTEPIASRARLQALEQKRLEAAKVEEPPSRMPQEAKNDETVQERVMRAMGQMGLISEAKILSVQKAQGISKGQEAGKVTAEDLDEEALFGSAIYDSAVYSEEEIFGSPQEADDEPSAPRKADAVPDMVATQPYQSQEGADMDLATQPYQDEPPQKRLRLSGTESMKS